MSTHAAPAMADILRNPAIWRIGQVPASVRAAIKTGFASLDQALPAHGWEQGALTEILSSEQGIGELSLLIPALRQVTQQGQGIVLVAPPCIPFPHAWEAHGIALKQLVMLRAEGRDLLWAAEQAARSGACGMVVAWTASCRKELNYQALRRLQMAAEAGGSTLVLYRLANAAGEASPAATRIAVKANIGELQLNIIKRRAALMSQTLPLNVYPPHWAQHHPAKATVLLNLPARQALRSATSASAAAHIPFTASRAARPLSAAR